MRHRPNPASRTTRHSDSKSERYSETSSRTLSSEFEAKQHAKSSNADSTSKSGNDDEILRQPIETTQESKPRKAQKEAKNIDDMLRQILPSHLMKDLSGKNKDRMENKDKSDDKSEDKSELTVHRYSYPPHYPRPFSLLPSSPPPLCYSLLLLAPSILHSPFFLVGCSYHLFLFQHIRRSRRPRKGNRRARKGNCRE